MRLTIKVIIIIGLTVTTILSVVFWVLNNQFERQVQNHLLTTARAVYDNIVITRKWVSDKEGVFVVKSDTEEINEYLTHPMLVTRDGDTLMLKNPALVTRELSELSAKIGKEFSYHLASLNYINPQNMPDPFEREALLYFKNKEQTSGKAEFIRYEFVDDASSFRYFAPLYTEESCLTCHADHGYSLGDLRGGISIILPTHQYQQAKRNQTIFFGSTWILTAVFLVSAMFYALQRSLIKPLREIEYSAERIQEGDYDHRLVIRSKDEIGHLASAFENMRKKVKAYTGRLKASELKYRNLIENSLEAVAIVDDDDRIIECSSKLTKLTGYEEADLKKHHLGDLLSSDRPNPIGRDRSGRNGGEHYETLLHSRDNLEIPVEIYRIRGLSLDVREKLSFVYIRDLSERKKFEKYALHTEKMFALGQISSGIAHEIRNPLFALNNNLDYLDKKFGENQAFRELYPDIVDSVKRIEKIVSAILDYSRPHELSFESIRIEEVINQALLLVQKQFEKSSIRIHTLFAENTPKVKADPHKLEQVFVNLFLNAFQAMEAAGILKVSTVSRNDSVEVSVEDTGKGMAPEELKRIFDPFFTKSPNGTGLGMSIVQSILEQHGAEYRIRSEIGLGTSFFIRFHSNQDEEHEV